MLKTSNIRATKPVLLPRSRVAVRVKALSKGPNYSKVQRNIALDLVRVTEASSLSAAKWLGKGDKYQADLVSVAAMRNMLNTIEMDGIVVIGEGEKDKSAMLYCGERVGNKHDPMKVDIAVDPLDGTRLVAEGRDGACSVISLATRGSLFDPRKAFYMDKLVVGPGVPADMVSLDHTVEDNLRIVSACLRKPIDEVTVVVLDRPRHEELVQQCRSAGARIKLISDGDISAAIDVVSAESAADVMMGVGGSPEGVLAACALKILGGSMQARLWAKSEEEREDMEDDGYDMGTILHIDDLCKSDDVFFALTGVTDCGLVKGVRFVPDGAVTHSLVMRSRSGTIRYMETHHRWNDNNRV